MVNLTALKELLLQGNSLNGQIPPALGNSLSALTVLNLGNNQFEGEIPASLANLRNLKELRLQGNSLNGRIPPALGNSLSALTVLNLSNNQLNEGIPASLSNLESLEELRLQNNALEGEIPSFLADLPELNTLLLHGNQFSGCIPLGLEGLVDPGLGVKPGTGRGALPDFCPPLERDVLMALYEATGGTTGKWKSNLNWGSEKPIGQWHGVTTYPRKSNGPVIYVDLRNNGLTGNIPPEIVNLTSLKKLRLQGNSLNEEIPPALGSSKLSKLTLLNLSNNDLKGQIPASLAKLKNLESLWLNGNQLSGEIPSGLGSSLSKLLALNLRNNDLEGEIPASLANLENLRLLQLSDNQLSGEIPSGLGNGLSKLRVLGLSDNDLDGEIPASLANLENLKEIYLRFNNFDIGACVPYVVKSRVESRTTKRHDLDYRVKFCKSPEELAEALRNGILRDRNALWALYHVTFQDGVRGSTDWSKVKEKFDNGCYFGSGAGPTVTSNGRIMPDLDQWCGITTNDDGRVIKVELGGIGAVNGEGWGIGLNGTIPNALGGMDALEVLDLSNGKVCGAWGCNGGLEGNIPWQLGNLPNLKEVDLSGNELEGFVPAWLINLGEANLEENKAWTCTPVKLEIHTPAWYRASFWRIEECTDEDLLNELYQQANGENWEGKNNWGSEEPISKWHGVIAHPEDSAKVLGLFLPDNELAGNLDAILGLLVNFEKLTYFDISNNPLSDMSAGTNEIKERIGKTRWGKRWNQAQNAYVVVAGEPTVGTVLQFADDLAELSSEVTTNPSLRRLLKGTSKAISKSLKGLEAVTQVAQYAQLFGTLHSLDATDSKAMHDAVYDFLGIPANARYYQLQDAIFLECVSRYPNLSPAEVVKKCTQELKRGSGGKPPIATSYRY